LILAVYLQPFNAVFRNDDLFAIDFEPLLLKPSQHNGITEPNIFGRVVLAPINQFNSFLFFSNPRQFL
jgi:hypothetical protein